MSNILKKISAFLMIALFFITPLKAYEALPPSLGSSNYLQTISQNTTGILTYVNRLPVYLRAMTKMALSWLAPDDSESTAELQHVFTTLGNASIQNAKTQDENQKKFLDYFFAFPKKENDFPNANDLTYQTLLKKPYFTNVIPPKGTVYDPAYNYILYSSGLNIRHRSPPTFFLNKRNPSIGMYINYYNTASAVQTYNGYLLSELYAESKNENNLQKNQTILTQKATSPDWFTQIASENIGIVLRQILLYNSQTYVLLTQLLETQKKLLAAQAMNNALLIAVNQNNEDILYSKAEEE
ncbi:MAG: hypothetical protein K0R24_1147 [Gammaproteobacteria bacterium]|jgi:hypothetical protein|nr:hypothetical protein [Gammaproteobacteria bacterium]